MGETAQMSESPGGTKWKFWRELDEAIQRVLKSHGSMSFEHDGLVFRVYHVDKWTPCRVDIKRK